MTVPIIAFFNNKGGVGKTTLVYHLCWMYADLNFRVIAADLDPQANLTAAFLDDDRLEQLWGNNTEPLTVFGSVHPLMRGVGDIGKPYLEEIQQNLWLLPGDLALSSFEDELSQVWPGCADGKERSFRVISAFWRVLQHAADMRQANFVLMDLGPNLGAINRAALIAADYIVIPVAPDLFSMQGLKNLGPTLGDWRKLWGERLEKKPNVPGLHLPSGSMMPLGYVVLQHSVRLDRPVKAYERWIARIPLVYCSELLGTQAAAEMTVETDSNCLSLLKHYRSLMPMAQEVRKPMFHLKPADGAIGSHAAAVQSAYRDFERLAHKIMECIGF